MCMHHIGALRMMCLVCMHALDWSFVSVPSVAAVSAFCVNKDADRIVRYGCPLVKSILHSIKHFHFISDLPEPKTCPPVPAILSGTIQIAKYKLCVPSSLPHHIHIHVNI